MSASREISLGQFVKQLVGRLQQEDVAIPLRNQEPWHALFYELARMPNAGRPTFLDEIIFDWDSPYPKCRELSEFLSALHFTASASARNPRFDTISVDTETAQRWSAQVDEDEEDLKAFVGRAVDLASKEFAASSGQ